MLISEIVVLTMSKTPVSLLQEYTAQHRLSTPDYTFYDVGHSLTPQFKCIVSLNNQTAEAVASNKKTAKHNAALKALQLLGCKDIPVDYVEECVTTVTTPNTPISCEINTSPGSNYVGILNEYASTNRQNYPTYDCESMGLVTPTFVVHCYFMGLVTAGTALNKKSAKQESAKLMLERFVSMFSDLWYNLLNCRFSIDKKLPPLTPKIKGVNIQPKKLHLDEDEVKLVLTKFNELSVSNPNDYKSKKSIGFINQILNIPQIENVFILKTIIQFMNG